ncbi:uncharacterized protein PHACADRAFT_52260, partial [Phanerochaete carnosa HHB-10118-sp]
AVPEGFSLAVMLTLAFTMKCMTREEISVHVFGPCKMMANASVVCTNKISTLTQNETTVIAGSLG